MGWRVNRGQWSFLEWRRSGGSIGHNAVARAPAAGYALLVAENILTLNQAVIPKLPLNLLRDLTPIVPIASLPMAIGANLPLTPDYESQSQHRQ